jgi:putative ABC transport system permease protein
MTAPFRGLLTLAAAHALHARARTILLCFSIAVAAFIPAATFVLSGSMEDALVSRASSTSLAIGGKGGSVDLVLATLYFRPARAGGISVGEWAEMDEAFPNRLIPVQASFTAGGVRIVAINPDYFDLRGLVVAKGNIPAMAGEVILGSRAARELRLSPGDSLFSDQDSSFDIAGAAAIKLRVSGILAPSSTPDDYVMFADLRTAWLLKGLMHAHADADSAIPESLVLGREVGKVNISEELVEDNTLTLENVSRLHMHADEASLPLTGVVAIGMTDRERTVLAARVNAAGKLQAVDPGEAVREILGHVARFRRVLEVVCIAVAILTCVLAGIILAMSARARERELLTLTRIGASRGTLIGVLAIEAAGILSVGLLLAAIAAGILALAPPDLMKFL